MKLTDAVFTARTIPRINGAPRRFLLPLLAGLLLGAGTRVARSVDGPARTVNPNVVVLRSEKLVTMEKPSVTLAQMAESFSQQTGRKVTLDPRFAADKTEYAFLLKGAPLTRSLAAVAYLADGVCERKGTGYLLRPITEQEKAGDLSRYEAAIDTVYATLKALPTPDPANATAMDRAIGDWLKIVERDRDDIDPFPLEHMADWKVNAGSSGFALSYSGVNPDDGLVHWRTVTWGF